MPRRKDQGQPAGGRPTVRLDTTVDAEADRTIRIEIVSSRGSLAAFWEAASRWIANHPDALTEILMDMEEDLNGRMRRRGQPSSSSSNGSA